MGRLCHQGGMIKVEKYVNQLMTSNCYVVFDNCTKRCVVIDPGSEKSEREIAFLERYGLMLDYIFVSHEHTDHNWGVNVLKERFPAAKIVYSEMCSKWVKKTIKAYFLLYYDDPDYHYDLMPADILIKRDDDVLSWNGGNIIFVQTPGHSRGSMCIYLNNMLFTGDTIMPYKPYFNGRDSNEEDWQKSIEKMENFIPLETAVYPGHGETLTFKEWLENFKP